MLEREPAPELAPEQAPKPKVFNTLKSKHHH